MFKILPQAFDKVEENLAYAVEEEGVLRLKKKKHSQELGFIGTARAFTDYCSVLLLRQEVRTQLELQKGTPQKPEAVAKFYEGLAKGE